ncbi:MAG TPA: TetR/AcrR family transcriptional regulator [Acidimicrobiia bacterium]|nr:TetR/AcrR family transcriptional regulator [Acidimicrobiia bacterium]
MATENPRRRPRPRPLRAPAAEQNDEVLSDALRQFVVDTVSEKIAEQTQRQTDKIVAKAARHAERLDKLTEGLDALDVWKRAEPGRRQSRFTRADIAEVALRIADSDGLDAVSMRRVASELGAGTMTLYHYVRTKDELFALVNDAIMAEIVVPDDAPLPAHWRDAITVIARRSRDALRKHSWMFDIADEPSVGPNAVRHFDQSLQAVASVPGSLADKLDVLTVVDEYVFGFCTHERSSFHDVDDDSEMIEYVKELVATGEYPALQRMIDEHGLEQLWAQIEGHAHDDARFDRNLARLLDGVERDLTAR